MSANQIKDLNKIYLEAVYGLDEKATPESGTGKYYKEGKPTKEQLAQREKREKIKEINRRIQISKTSMSTKSSASIGYADEMNCLKSLKNEMNTLQKEVDDFAVKLAEKYIKNPPKPLGEFDLRRSDEERASKSRTLTADNLRQLEAENK